MYKQAHINIRKDPKRERKVPMKKQKKEVDEGIMEPKKRWNAKKLTNVERKQHVIEAKAAYLKELQSENTES